MWRVSSCDFDDRFLNAYILIKFVPLSIFPFLYCKFTSDAASISMLFKHQILNRIAFTPASVYAHKIACEYNPYESKMIRTSKIFQEKRLVYFLPSHCAIYLLFLEKIFVFGWILSFTDQMMDRAPLTERGWTNNNYASVADIKFQWLCLFYLHMKTFTQTWNS